MIGYSKNCYGCSACANICPQNAISIVDDEYGFIFPRIDKTKCNNCELCKNICPVGKFKKHMPLYMYAAKSRDMEILKDSASGGVFAEIAKQVLKQGGVAFGAYMDEDFNVKHISIHTLDELKKLQGSKYVQSFIGDCFKECKEYLNNNKKVVFSGTPCQIAGLKSFLGMDYESLLSIDVICHGVSSNKFFLEYLRREEQTKRITIKSFIFRSKVKGWGKIIGCMEYIKNDKLFKKLIWPISSFYYYYYYLCHVFYRECCYSCEYACEERVSDITIGDFWGIENAHKNIVTDKTWDIKTGVSCVIINTLKGQKYFAEMKEGFIIEDSTIDIIKKANANLNSPTKKPNIRENLLEIYRTNGCYGVEQYWKKTTMLHRYKGLIIRLLPKEVIHIYKHLKVK